MATHLNFQLQRTFIEFLFTLDSNAPLATGVLLDAKFEGDFKFGVTSRVCVQRIKAGCQLLCPELAEH